MKRILRKAAFFAIVVFIAFTLVASNGITQRKLATIAQTPNGCLMLSSSRVPTTCTNNSNPLSSPSSVSPLLPDLKLPEDKRFLAIVASKLPTIPQPGSLEYILLNAYGAVFANQQPEIKLPQKVILASSQETSSFQATLTMGKVDGTSNCLLQKAAAEGLNQAKALTGISLRSGYGASDCTRSFETNLRFWRKYANNQTLDQVRQGKETKILGIVAPPGASQHLWGLAVDLSLSSQSQRQALNRNGWFQTVENDVPHWTYVGLTEDKLPLFGFKNKVVRGITYWLTPL
ncbi:MAG: D-alanyl-D-alanine carboxypeptidase family protein [Cyanomargarita calcarea GSE-NOS-MK-12-04C]|jgi:hypothetical protein|uniref:D-alanyl-D-alanine carboxypeptidase family protein n=1 Tax=Cyanomargarita calcarea GSE-NOS-MK-12-04C TaxID=2839659 RepID=A0A951QR55_9CYAN|nr:D-alanyl-D-alanine carboxypeptidase family protein [Cyanomargarita calcarea GSE-NOS-MK-12-04C]